MEATHTTGLAIALRIGDEVWARAYGYADVENGSPLKPEASFRLASVNQADDRGRSDPARRCRENRPRRGDPDLRAVLPAQGPSGDGAPTAGPSRRDLALPEPRERAVHQKTQG